MQKRWTVAFAAVLVTAATAMQAHAQLPSELHSDIGLCIQPTGGMSAGNGAVIVQVPCDPHDESYRWKVEFMKYAGGRPWYRIRNSGTLLCLDLTDGRTADGTPLQLWQCNDTSTTMFWSYQNYGGTSFINGRSGKCMDVRAGSWEPGTVIQNYHCPAFPDYNDNPAQRWSWGPF